MNHATDHKLIIIAMQILADSNFGVIMHVEAAAYNDVIFIKGSSGKLFKEERREWHF